jgi:uncharacterized protein YfaS (alpha-2-macroglobulin family)
MAGMLIATKGKDVAFVVTSSLRKAEYGKTVAYVFNDRGLYRPKEDVRK